MNFNVALIGNPNCGKTTIFNKLTGGNQYVGNWPGVTVEKKEGFLKEDKSIKIVDLPGIYSLTPYTNEEIVSRNFLFKEKPDLILNVVSGVNIERNLFLTLQLLETNIPVIIIFSMMDKIKKRKEFVDLKKISDRLNCEFIENSSSLISKKLISLKEKKNNYERNVGGIRYSLSIEKYIKKIEDVLGYNNTKGKEDLRFRAIRILEKDYEFRKEEEIFKLNLIIKEAEDFFKEDTKRELIKNRYELIDKILDGCVDKKGNDVSISDKIDSVVTDKILALPIFFVIEAFVYYFCINLLGRPLSNFLEDFLKGCIVPSVEAFLNALEVESFIKSLVIDGVLSGVGTVLTFVPQIFFLFLFLSLLEDCGYMARVAFILDRLFVKFGLCGKSVISFLVSSGCGVNGIMSTKTIKDEKSRFSTIVTTTFIPCNAKLPIIFVITSYIFKGSFISIVLVYFLCILAIFILGSILKKQGSFKSEESDFVMELSPYNLPNLKNTIYYTFINVKAFVSKVGSVIFLASVLIWFLINFGFFDGKFCFVSQENSLLCRFGKILTPLFIPLGFGRWEAVVATLSGIFAKENIVNTFSVILKSAQNKNDGLLLKELFNGDFASLSFLIFNMLCAPCFAAIAAIFKETRNFKVTLKIIFFQTICAYLFSLFIYQLAGLLFLEVKFSFYTIVSFISLIFVLYLIFVPEKKSNS